MVCWHGPHLHQVFFVEIPGQYWSDEHPIHQPGLHLPLLYDWFMLWLILDSHSMVCWPVWHLSCFPCLMMALWYRLHRCAIVTCTMCKLHQLNFCMMPQLILALQTSYSSAYTTPYLLDLIVYSLLIQSSIKTWIMFTLLTYFIDSVSDAQSPDV